MTGNRVWLIIKLNGLLQTLVKSPWTVVRARATSQGGSMTRRPKRALRLTMEVVKAITTTSRQKLLVSRSVCSPAEAKVMESFIFTVEMF